MIDIQTLSERAKKLALGQYGATRYNNGYPYNVGFWNGNTWSFDCLGFVHTIINGFDGDRSVLGGGAVMDDFVLATPEYNTIYDYCTDISNNFGHLIPGEILQNSGHVGLYIGEYIPFSDGRVFNTAECTNAFGGGVILTYVDQYGQRYNHKGGVSGVKPFTLHGKCVRVVYGDTPTPEPVPELTPKQILDVCNDVLLGNYGTDPQRKEALISEYGGKMQRKVQDIINLLYA